MRSVFDSSHCVAFLHDVFKALFGNVTSVPHTFRVIHFSEHPDSPYVMLADNIAHPFNEYLLLTVNYGLVGLFVATYPATFQCLI